MARFVGKILINVLLDVMVECSQPPYFRTPEKKEAKRVRSTRGGGGGGVGVCKRSEQKEWKGADIFRRQWTY